MEAHEHQRRLPGVTLKLRRRDADTVPIIALYQLTGLLRGGDEAQIDEPVTITVTNADGDVIARADGVVEAVNFKGRTRREAVWTERRHVIRA